MSINKYLEPLLPLNHILTSDQDMNDDLEEELHVISNHEEDFSEDFFQSSVSPSTNGKDSPTLLKPAASTSSLTRSVLLGTKSSVGSLLCYIHGYFPISTSIDVADMMIDIELLPEGLKKTSKASSSRVWAADFTFPIATSLTQVLSISF